MKNDVIVQVNKDGLVYLDTTDLGVNNENAVSNIVFKFIDDFVDGVAWLEVEKGNTKGYIPMTKENNTYKIPIKSSLLSEKGKIYLQLRITLAEVESSIPVYKTKRFFLNVLEAINSTATIPEEYPTWIDVINSKLDVNNIIAGDNITLDKVGKNITINSTASGGTANYNNLTNKPKINNVELSGNKSFNDLGIINFSGNYNDLTNKPSIPTKTSDLTNDSGFIDNTYHDSTKVDKETGKVLSTNDYTTAEKTKLAGLNNYDDTEVRSLIANKQDIIQYETMPVASASNVNDIVQFIGTTDSNYTNGYFYKNINTQIQESITATQTDNVVPLGTITLNNSEFKSQVSAGTHEFYYRPYDTVLNFSNISVFPPVMIQVTRDNTFDRSPMIPNAPKLYSWVDNNNNFYATDTLQPNGLTKLYLLDIQTNDLTDTGATFISSNTPSLIEGRWTKKEGDIYTDVELSDYGILLSSSGLPGNTIQVNYIEASNTYNWTRINVQPDTTGASALTELTDVSISSPSNEQILKYNSTTSKWENGNAPSGGVSDVQIDGTSIVSSGVANIPKITGTQNAVSGVIWWKPNVYSGSGFLVDNYGFRIISPTNNGIEQRKGDLYAGYSAITTSSYDYAVKQAIASVIGSGNASRNIAYTDTEKQNVWTRFNIIKTTLDSVLVPLAQYYLGEQSSLDLTLPSTASAGQIITVDFASGSTPTTLTISGNVAGDITYAPTANTLVEINFKFDGTYFKMLVSSVATPTDEE